MSWNIHVAIPQEDHDNKVRVMILTRAKAGLTTTATVSNGDTLDFGGIQMDISKIIHYHSGGTDDKAPNSSALCYSRPLFDAEIDVLIQHGFRNL